MIRRAVPTFVLAFLVMSTSVATDEKEIGHLIPPGYTPEQLDDERGLWLEFEEIELQLKKSALLVEDVYLNNYVRDIVCRVAGPYCEDFRVYVMRNPGFNASMTATGMMQIWTGLITRASSSDEIAAVVGHEIAHYTRLHSLEKLRDMKKKAATGVFLDLILVAATGYSGVGQAAAMMSILSFSREQETEADILGSRLLAQAQYDPHASYRVWQKVIEEEESAVVKREEPTAFSSTHPEAEARMRYLKSWVTARYGQPDIEIVADQPFIDLLNENYMYLMEDQIDTNRFGRTKEILARHAEIGVEPSLVRFFYGEMFRQRGGPGDDDQAMAAYRHSIEHGRPPSQAYKNLGYLHLKKGEVEKARDNFRSYLELDPEASDRAMIEFYLEES